MMDEPIKGELQKELEELKAKHEQLSQQIGRAEARAYGRLTELEAENDTLRKQLFAINKYVAAALLPLPFDLEVTREALAAYAHDAWSGWMKYMFGKCGTANRYFTDEEVVTIPKDLVERWQRQMKTPYHKLPEIEKESDRAEADKIMAMLVRIAKGEEG